MAEDLILVVEADAKSRSVLELSLKKAGYSVHMFERGRDALEWLEDAERLPGLIISGTELPGMSGFEFCARLKENIDWEPLPFVFLTDAGSTEAKRRGFELGVEDFLTRPIYVKEITARVELLLQRRRKELMAVADAEEVTGPLEDGTLIDLLQAIEEHDRTGVAEFSRGERRGVIYFSQGQVVDASAGKLRGAEAVNRLMLWAEGTCTVRYMASVDRRDRIGEPTQDLLLKAMRGLDRWEEIRTRGPGLERVFEVNYRQLADHLRDLPDEVNSVIRLFDGYRTVADVIDDSTLGAVETMKVIGKLADQELIHDVTPERGDDDLIPDLGGGTLSDWLDTEAGETVEPRGARKASPAETEAQKVRRRREERKRRKLDSRRRHGGSVAMGVTLEDEEDDEEARLRAELAEAEARAEALRSETDTLARQRQRRDEESAETLRLRARLAEAEAAAARLAQEREQLRAELEGDHARKAAEAARAEAERKAAEEAARAEAERKAAEEAARLQAEKAAEEAARAEAERKAAEEAARKAAAEEAIRRAEEEARRRAAEEAARLEEARAAAEEAARKAAEEVARIEAERKAVEEAARAEAERKAAEELARAEAEKAAAEEAARLQAEKEAVEEVARLAAARVAAEEAAKLEAVRKELEEAQQRAREEAERLEALKREAEEARQKAADEVARIEAERKAAEEAARAEAERKATEELARVEAEKAAAEEAAKKAAEEAARLEAERKAAEEAAQKKAAEEADRLAAVEAAARKADEEAARLKAEKEAAEEADRKAAEEKKAAEKKAADEKKAAEEAAKKAAKEAERKAAEEKKAAEAKKDDGDKAMAPPPSPDPGGEDAFFRSEPGFYEEPAPVEGGGGSTRVAVGVLILLAVVVAVYLWYDGQKNKPVEPVKPGVSASNQSGKGDQPVTPAATPDAGVAATPEGDTADAGVAATSNADAGSEAVEAAETTPAQVAEAVQKASDVIWNVGHLQAGYHPETGLNLVLAPGEEPLEAPTEEKKDEQAANTPAVNNTPPTNNTTPRPVVNNNPGNTTPRDPKPVREETPPVVNTPDPALANMDDAAQKREVEKLVREADRLIKSKRFADAIQKLNQARTLAPGSGQVNKLLGIAYHQSGNSKAAIPYLERTVRSNGSDAGSVAMLGDAYMATGARSKAVATYEKYLVLRPSGKLSDSYREIIGRNR